MIDFRDPYNVISLEQCTTPITPKKKKEVEFIFLCLKVLEDICVVFLHIDIYKQVSYISVLYKIIHSHQIKCKNIYIYLQLDNIH